jgi:hypothetical protein
MASTFFTADFHARDVRRRVGAKRRAGEARRQPPRVGLVGRRDHHRRRQPGADLAGERGAGQHGQRPRPAEHLARHLVGELAGFDFEALGRPGDPRIPAQQRRKLGEHGAECMTRHGHDDDRRLRQCPAQVGLDGETVGKVRAGKVALVLAILLEAIEVILRSPPEQCSMAAAGELDCERGAPGAGPDDDDDLVRAGRPLAAHA